MSLSSTCLKGLHKLGMFRLLLALVAFSILVLVHSLYQSTTLLNAPHHNVPKKNVHQLHTTTSSHSKTGHPPTTHHQHHQQQQPHVAHHHTTHVTQVGQEVPLELRTADSVPTKTTTARDYYHLLQGKDSAPHQSPPGDAFFPTIALSTALNRKPLAVDEQQHEEEEAAAGVVDPLDIQVTQHWGRYTFFFKTVCTHHQLNLLY